MTGLKPKINNTKLYVDKLEIFGLEVSKSGVRYDF